jgi:MFS family permease
MNWRNRIGLYGSYFLGTAGIGFTLPYLPLFLGERGLSDRSIGAVSTLAALSGLLQFPVGLWSDRIGRRKQFLLAALAALAASTVLIGGAGSAVWLGLLAVLFAENGVCRAVVESLSGAEAAALAPPGEVGAALGALRFWKTVAIIAVALLGSELADRYGPAAILAPLSVITGLSVLTALMIREHPGGPSPHARERETDDRPRERVARDPALWAFVAAMLLFHAANAPGGVYLGLFLKRDLHAPDRMLAYAFTVSMTAWMLVVRPAGRLADRVGRRPLLIACWAVMALRLGLVALVLTPWEAVANQALDGLANGLFAVLAAAWVTDRLADPRRAGEAQVIVGTSLVLGSAIGPAVAAYLVGPLGYRGLFAALAALGAVATALVVALVPESLAREPEAVGPLATVSDLSANP